MAAFQDPSLDLPFVIVHRVGPVIVPFVFPLRPQRAENGFPARGMIHQTLDGNFLDDFSGKGAVLATVSLQGTFGYKPRVGGIGVLAPGSFHLKAFETLFETFNALDRALKARVQAVQEYLDLSRLHYWQVWIRNFQYRRASNDPLLAHYQMDLVRRQDYLSPVGPSLPGLTASAVGLGTAAVAAVAGAF